MAKQDFKDIILSKGEVVLKNCDYLTVEGGDFEQKATLMLTNKRFIHRSISHSKKNTSIHLEEVNIHDIDSLSYQFTEAKKPVNIIALIISFLLIVGGVVLYILMSKTYMFAISAVGIIVLLIAIFSRKKTSAFSIDVISYHAQNDHLCLDEHKDIEDSVENRNSNAILLLVLLLVFGGLGFLAYYFKDMLPNENLLYVIIGVLGALYLFFLVRFIVSFKKGSKKTVKVNIPTDAKPKKSKKDSKDKLDVGINIDGIRDLINDMGALILNCKR